MNWKKNYKAKTSRPFIEVPNVTEKQYNNKIYAFVTSALFNDYVRKVCKYATTFGKKYIIMPIINVFSGKILQLSQCCGQQSGYTKCYLCLWNSRDRQNLSKKSLTDKNVRFRKHPWIVSRPSGNTYSSSPYKTWTNYKQFTTTLNNEG